MAWHPARALLNCQIHSLLAARTDYEPLACGPVIGTECCWYLFHQTDSWMLDLLLCGRVTRFCLEWPGVLCRALWLSAQRGSYCKLWRRSIPY